MNLIWPIENPSRTRSIAESIRFTGSKKLVSKLGFVPPFLSYDSTIGPYDHTQQFLLGLNAVEGEEVATLRKYIAEAR